MTQSTVVWYKQAFKRFEGAMESRETAVQRIGELKERGLSVVSINCHLRVANAFWKWNGQNVHIPRLKEEQKILATFSREQIARLVRWKPVGRNQIRAHAIALVALDTGLRISELLGLSRKDVDFDNLVLLAHGNGNKQRLAAMSIELRKVLYRHMANHNQARVFCTGMGTQLSVRNSERDFKVLCGKAGIVGVRC